MKNNIFAVIVVVLCMMSCSTTKPTYIRIYKSALHLKGEGIGFAIADHITVVNNEIFCYDMAYNDDSHSVIVGHAVLQNDTLVLTSVSAYENGVRKEIGDLFSIPLRFKVTKNSIIDITRYKDYAAYSDEEWVALTESKKNDSIAMRKLYEALTPFDLMWSGYSLGEFKQIKSVKADKKLRRKYSVKW